MKFIVKKKTFLGDLATPVSIYLNIKSQYPGSVLLESSDYSNRENASSFIAFNPIAEISITKYVVTERLLRKERIYKTLNNKEVLDRLHEFFAQFELEDNTYIEKANAIFGYLAYDAVQYFENITFKQKPTYHVPDIRFTLFKYVVEFKHFSNEIIFVELLHKNITTTKFSIESLLFDNKKLSTVFQKVGTESSNMNDNDFMQIVEKCRSHCQKGNVFQIVPSRKFIQAFKGDDFLLYRILRSINPSPYQFYFDYDHYHLLGSSPETQIRIKQSKAYIYPIAGTFPRTGNEAEDLRLAQQLKKDAKEIAEHTMLVDLARNDLSKNAINICVEKFSEIQFFSHVIHLVSKVSGEIDIKKKSHFDIVYNTFPAGTLSGAPKYRAMELIDEMEPTARGFFGGAVGTISFNKEVDLAIMIRSMISKNNYLYYQAGAGVVVNSIPKKELMEVNNKLAAIRKAINIAETIFT